MSVTDVTTDSWEHDIGQSTLPVLVDFWAPWCAPCKQIAPIVEALAEEMGDRMRVAKLDIDQHPAIASRFAVLSIPTLILFNGGEPVARVVGAKKRRAIESAIIPHLAN